MSKPQQVNNKQKIYTVFKISGNVNPELNTENNQNTQQRRKIQSELSYNSLMLKQQNMKIPKHLKQQNLKQCITPQQLFDYNNTKYTFNDFYKQNDSSITFPNMNIQQLKDFNNLDIDVKQITMSGNKIPFFELMQFKCKKLDLSDSNVDDQQLLHLFELLITTFDQNNDEQLTKQENDPIQSDTQTQQVSPDQQINVDGNNDIQPKSPDNNNMRQNSKSDIKNLMIQCSNETIKESSNPHEHETRHAKITFVNMHEQIQKEQNQPALVNNDYKEIVEISASEATDSNQVQQLKDAHTHSVTSSQLQLQLNFSNQMDQQQTDSDKIKFMASREVSEYSEITANKQKSDLNHIKSNRSSISKIQIDNKNDLPAIQIQQIETKYYPRELQNSPQYQQQQITNQLQTKELIVRNNIPFEQVEQLAQKLEAVKQQIQSKFKLFSSVEELDLSCNNITDYNILKIFINIFDQQLCKLSIQQIQFQQFKNQYQQQKFDSQQDIQPNQINQDQLINYLEENFDDNQSASMVLSKNEVTQNDQNTQYNKIYNIKLNNIRQLNHSNTTLKQSTIKQLAEDFPNLEIITLHKIDTDCNNISLFLNFCNLRSLDLTDSQQFRDINLIKAFIRNGTEYMPCLEEVLLLISDLKNPKVLAKQPPILYFHIDANNNIFNDQPNLAKLPISNKYFTTQRIINIIMMQRGPCLGLKLKALTNTSALLNSSAQLTVSLHKQMQAKKYNIEKIGTDTQARKFLVKNSLTVGEKLNQKGSQINISTSSRYVDDSNQQDKFLKSATNLSQLNQSITSINNNSMVQTQNDQLLFQKSAQTVLNQYKRTQSQLQDYVQNSNYVQKKLVRPQSDRRRFVQNGADNYCVYLQQQQQLYSDNPVIYQVVQGYFSQNPKNNNLQSAKLEKNAYVYQMQQEKNQQLSQQEVTGFEKDGFYLTQIDTELENNTEKRGELASYNQLQMQNINPENTFTKSIFDKDFQQQNQQMNDLIGPLEEDQLMDHPLDFRGLEKQLIHKDKSSVKELYKALRYVLENPTSYQVNIDDDEVIRSLFDQ